MSAPRLWRSTKIAVVMIVLSIWVIETWLLGFPFLYPTDFSTINNVVLVADRPLTTDDQKGSDVLNDVPTYEEGVKGNFEPEIHEVIGVGEGGKPHKVHGRRKEEQRQKSLYGMNMVVSDEISPNRTIPDTRLEECKNWNYPAELPPASVIVVFHKEGLSVLMRTVHSVVNRSPSQLLHEVVLVDDFSKRKNLEAELEQYVVKNFPDGLVRVIRNTERQGLIRSRAHGAEVSRGEVIIFLDAHCEVGYNWLPPLLAPIKQNRKTMTVPVIDGIDMETFEYKTVYNEKQHSRGIFEWGMFYKEIEIPEEEIKRRTHHSEPYKSPTHAGGLFAMDREYFLTLGGYDPDLLVWGGENFELSFKIWQCGGQILWVPCSKVGHVYKGVSHYQPGNLPKKREGPITLINYKRVVEVWMDEFKEYFYRREPMARYYDAGDLSDQLAIREKLKCKPFSWFMKEVAYDVLKNFPYPPKNAYWGRIRSLKKNSSCLDLPSSEPGTKLSTYGCHKGAHQIFRLNSEGQLGAGERCVDADKEKMYLTSCTLGTVDGPWSYDKGTKQLLHFRKLIRCLNLDGEKLSLSLCRRDEAKQQFKFEEMRPSKN